ncbi:hypothetical protein BRYFOR_05445 [Marvinbryantia formatexigens DSM 14469]|uniref:Uncharacterized protein n=1 Tax=Marvinbryantia formatexigens DSM 14469 TaxID=478749 RepID=C6LA03_9FIRM|nr:hypothetical protein BRYFOR_05445 [Marvinbryantia formatexigens DSM 14469]
MQCIFFCALLQYRCSKEGYLMSERDIDIDNMQCRVFRIAQTRWKKSP